MCVTPRSRDDVARNVSGNGGRCSDGSIARWIRRIPALGAIVIIVVVRDAHGGTDGGGTEANTYAYARGPAPAINAAAISYAASSIRSAAINAARTNAACAHRAGMDAANADAAATVRRSISRNACDTKNSSGDGSNGSIRHGTSFFRLALGRWPTQCHARTVRLPLESTVRHGW